MIVTYEDMTGARLGFLEVKRLIRRSPEVIYEAYCHNCHTTTTYLHEYLGNVGACKGRECRLIAERKAAQQARDSNTPVPKNLSECPPLDPRSYDAWLRMRDEQLRNRR